MMAVDHNVFSLHAANDFGFRRPDAQWNQMGMGDAGEVVFVGFPAIQQENRYALIVGAGMDPRLDCSNINFHGQSPKKKKVEGKNPFDLICFELRRATRRYSRLLASQLSPASFVPIAPHAPYGLGRLERAPSQPSGARADRFPVSTELGMKRVLLSANTTCAPAP